VQEGCGYKDTLRASLLCSVGKIFHCVHYLSAARRISCYKIWELYNTVIHIAYTRTQPYLNQFQRERYHSISADLNTERETSLKDKNVNLINIISKENICIFNHQYPVSCLLRIQIDF